MIFRKYNANDLDLLWLIYAKIPVQRLVLLLVCDISMHVMECDTPSIIHPVPNAHLVQPMFFIILQIKTN